MLAVQAENIEEGFCLTIYVNGKRTIRDIRSADDYILYYQVEMRSDRGEKEAKRQKRVSSWPMK